MRDRGLELTAGLAQARVGGEQRDGKRCGHDLHRNFVEVVRTKSKKLESEMHREMRRIPIYERWLKNVFGVGPITAAYILSYVDIEKSTYPSSLKKYCGFGVSSNGKRMDACCPEAKDGTIGRMDLRVIITLMLNGIRIACGKTDETTGARRKPNKYVKIWDDYKARAAASGELEAKGKGYVDAKGRRKAADVFIEDLYTVWRSLEGLPVWPAWYAAKCGYSHGGKIFTPGATADDSLRAQGFNVPRHMTFDEALALIE